MEASHSIPFGERLRLLIEKFAKNKNHFAKILGIGGSRLDHPLANPNSNPQLDLLSLILSKLPEVNPFWLITGEGEMTTPKKVKSEIDDKELLVVTVDTEGQETPVYVSTDAYAGYLNGYNDPRYIQNLPAVNVPFLRGRDWRLFQVKGDSMEPTLFETDILFAERVYSPKNIGNGRIYIIVSRGVEDGIVAKRVVRREGEDFLTLYSDNKHYEPKKVHLKEVSEIWHVRRRFTAQMPNPSNIEERLFDLEKTVFELQQEVAKLKGK